MTPDLLKWNVVAILARSHASQAVNAMNIKNNLTDTLCLRLCCVA